MFESALEKLGRILAGQYGIDVIFEGNIAYTDGKKIVLPNFSDLTEEIKQDLHGYLDHEVAHCKFTTFDSIRLVKSRFHRELLNATEDSRIEIEMIKEYPGAKNFIDPLNEKLLAKLGDRWSTLPLPVRVILGVRDLMEGREARIDDDTREIFNKISPDAKKLSEMTSTEELRLATEKIIEKIKVAYDEEKAEEKKAEKAEKGEKGDGEKSEKEKGEKSEAKAEGKADEETSDGDEGDADESEDSDEEGETGSDAEAESKPAKKAAGSKPKSSSTTPEKREETEAMMADKVGEESDWDEQKIDVHSLINDEIKDKIAKEEKVSHRSYMIDPKMSVIPVTTRFDLVTDHTAKGNAKRYADLKKTVSPMVQPIKTALERVLKVKENARWQSERERGGIDARNLAKLASNKAYRTVFRQFTRTETDNVAVQILVDMSGSMCDKIVTATQTVIAMGEALRDLNITFEVTGFNSVRDSRVSAEWAKAGSSRRFTRRSERLDLHVFKSFESTNLSGIEKIFAGSENPDGECIWWAAKRLAARKEKRKILIVLSDGMPSTGDSRDGVLNFDLKKKVGEISKAGVEVIGIGIQTEAVCQFYPDYIVINEIHELPKKAVQKLAGLIAR